MYGYIYLTENLINHKKYIGQHKSKTFSKTYKGSGKLLIKAFKKYGIENFSCICLKTCESKDELNNEEIAFIAKYDAVKSEDFYNISKGGEGHTCEAWNKGKKGCYKASEKQLAALQRGQRLPASQKQKEQLSKRRKGIIVSDETREKCRIAGLKAKRLKGYKWMTNGSELKRVDPENIQKFLDLGFHFGQK